MRRLMKNVRPPDCFRAPLRAFGLVVLTLSCVAAAPAPIQTQIQGYLDGLVKNGPNPGISAAISLDSSASYFNAGFADREGRIVPTEHTAYRIGSVTKALTGTAVEVLAAQGSLKLDAPVNLYLRKPLPGDFVQPTLQQLLDMSGGIPHGWLYLATPDDNIQESDAPYAVVATAPGSGFVYSNYSYGVLGVALSRSLRRPFSEVMRSYVFAPLGMHDSFVNERPRRGVLIAKPYYHKDAEAAPNLFLYPMAGGGAFSSASDLLRFTLYHMGEVHGIPHFPPTLATHLHSRSHLSNGYYTHGWAQVVLNTSHEVWLANGEAVGGCATLLALPSLHLAIVVATNICHDRQTDEIATHILSVIAPADAVALHTVLDGGGDGQVVSPLVFPVPAGKWNAAVAALSKHHTINISFDGTRAACAIDTALPQISAFSVDGGVLSFPCGGPPTAEEFVGPPVSEMGPQSVTWSASIELRGNILRGALGARTKRDNGFNLNFAISGQKG